MKTSILIIGKKGSGKTAYLNKILALLPEGSYCDGKKLVPITETLKYVFLEDVRCSFIDDILNNENQYKHIFTSSENIDKVNAMRNIEKVLVYNLDDKTDAFLLGERISNLEKYHTCTSCNTSQYARHKQCIDCGKEFFVFI